MKSSTLYLQAVMFAVLANMLLYMYLTDSLPDSTLSLFAIMIVASTLMAWKLGRSHEAQIHKSPKEENRVPRVTLGWDGHPTITTDGKHVLPRKAEMILHGKYYPNGEVGEWPIDPDTGEKLLIDSPKYKFELLD
ncbi:MAG: hypothetical protein ACWA44_02370 [Thiotrichales bacterium]